MAQIHASGPSFDITSQDTYILGDGDESCVSAYHVQLVSTSFVGSVSPQARSRQKAAADASVPFVGASYVGLWVNGAAGTQALVSTAITTDSELYIPAGGRTVALNCSAFTGGKLTAYVTPIIGSVI